jgi:hypothetical protein
MSVRAIYYSKNSDDCVTDIPAEYKPLLARGMEIVKRVAGRDNNQVLVLQTADNQIHEAIIDWTLAVEDDEGQRNLFHAMGKENPIVRLICLWEDGAIDVPAYDFRISLCTFNPDNENAQMLLLGYRQMILKTIRATLPKDWRKTQLEIDVMLAISKELPAYKDILMEQYARSTKTRTFTGHGFYTNFDNVGDGILVDKTFNKVLGVPSAILNQTCTVGFALFIRDGRITMLEGYTFGGDWPDTIDTYDIF